MQCDTMILSDLHLGSELSRASDALRLLKGSCFRRLILLGDIFCDLNFSRLKKEHWQFLSYIRKLSNPKRQVEVVWVEGNHDQGLTNVMSHLVGVRVYHEYRWDFGGIKHLAIHGHQFDRFVIDNAILSRFVALLYLQLQKLDWGRKRTVRFLDQLNTAWLRLSEKVAHGALEYAAAQGAQRVFCGHTHKSMFVERDGIVYYNSGNWVDLRATYIAIDESGVRLLEFSDVDEPAEEDRSALVAPSAEDIPELETALF